MAYIIREESLDSVCSSRGVSEFDLNWPSVFVLPWWLKAWWQVFNGEGGLYLREISEDRKILGIAPLVVKGDTASFIGSIDVCDYLDFILVNEKATEFFTGLLENLAEKGIKYVDLQPVREDSTVFTRLLPMAKERGCEIVTTAQDVSLEMDLPASWDAYLELLETKQRHEIRRKIRRLSESGKVDFSFTGEVSEITKLMDSFLKLFVLSREDKAAFLTERMEKFFRSMTKAAAEAGILKLGVLKIDAKTMAMVLCFDYQDCLYLYNSAFDRAFDFLSVGLLSKVFAIREAIQMGRKRFDFLKGSEPYKYQLGGKEVRIFRCRITVS
jgi:CelD/BcsL family acetyltransferase involved in cellulose biosynthesis